jgi:hypothetical protein
MGPQIRGDCGIRVGWFGDLAEANVLISVFPEKRKFKKLAAVVENGFMITPPSDLMISIL